MMNECCAPQWVDFTSSPQLSDSYFDINHTVHESVKHLKSNNFNASLQQKVAENIAESGNTINSQNDSKIKKAVSVKMAHHFPHKNVKALVKDTTDDPYLYQMSTSLLGHKFNNANCYENSLNDVPPRKTKQRRFTSTIKSSSAKKTIINHEDKDKPSLPNEKEFCVKLEENAELNLTKDKTQSISEYVKNDVIDESQSYKIVYPKLEPSKLFRKKKHSVTVPRSTVLTCSYRRQSLKYRIQASQHRRESKKFVSMAEAISKFHNETPERFRTLKNGDPGPLTKLKRQVKKLTLPISPALRCKKRTRNISVLSTEQRELLEMEKLKKNQIKANPVPANVLKGPSVLKKIPKKPATVVEEFRFTKPKNVKHATGSHMHAKEGDKEHDPKSLLSISPGPPSSSILNPSKKSEMTTTKSVLVQNKLPFAFEERNKEFQTKKELKLKALQCHDANKIKEFHARPAPKFVKLKNPVKEQGTKKIVPCPFSFEQRDKSLAKKKEELVKHMQEKLEKPRVFHANPAPSFKPVAVHGLAKENIRGKEKTADSVQQSATRLTKSFVEQENKQPNIVRQNEKRSKSILDTVSMEKEPEIQNKKEKINKSKLVTVELYTDKRAKERSEFDEKIRRREREEAMKRQEEEKRKLEKQKLESIELRKMTEIKARPMPVYKPMVLLKSNKPPTSPHSPALGNKNKPKRLP